MVLRRVEEEVLPADMCGVWSSCCDRLCDSLSCEVVIFRDSLRDEDDASGGERLQSEWPAVASWRVETPPRSLLMYALGECLRAYAKVVAKPVGFLASTERCFHTRCAER